MWLKLRALLKLREMIETAFQTCPCEGEGACSYTILVERIKLTVGKQAVGEANNMMVSSGEWIFPISTPDLGMQALHGNYCDR